MKKTFLLASLFAFSLVLGRTSLAQTEARTQEQQRLRISPVATGAQVRNENQVQNQEEERVNNETSESATPKSVSQRSQTARQHMSIVAQKVEEILANRTTEGGIGEQVREIARSQNQAQGEIETGIERLDSRPGWLKTIIGPDFRAIKSVRQEIIQNQVRIRQLKELENKLENQGEADQVREMIEALIQENTSLQERLNLEEETRGFLGWLFRLFAE